MLRLVHPLPLYLLQGLQLFRKIALKDGKGEAGFLGKVLRVHVHEIGLPGRGIPPEVEGVGIEVRLILWVRPEGEGGGLSEMDGQSSSSISSE